MILSALSVPRALTLVGALSLPALLSAQDPTEVTGWASPGGVLQPEQPVTGYCPDVPVPPKALMGDPPAHSAPAVPDGPFRAGPNTPASQALDVAQQPNDTGQFRYFQNEVVRPSGASTSTTGEPSVAVVRDTVFQTGNWYAARSVDAGQTFTYISPYSWFGALDGGFCCDQRVYYHEARDITIWLLQYSYSSSTQNGSYRIAIANGRADLQSTSASAWTRYTWNPGMMGFGAGNWFDFPDIAATGDKLFVSANTFSGSGQGYQGSVVWIMDLADMAAAQAVSWSYVRSSSLLGNTYRFAEGGASDRIYFGSLRDTSSHYIYRLTNAGSWSRVTRNIGTYSAATASRPGPDGRDWCGRVTGRFRGTFGNSSEIGFLMTSAARPSNGRPQPYTRVSRFTANDARTLIAEHDIWSSTTAFAYATGRANLRGDIGLVMAIGSATSYVRSAATLIDQYQPWGGLTVYPMANGTHGPSSNRWGDYFDVHRHEQYDYTFVGTGMEQNGGSGGSSNQPRFVWFGRDDDEPTWVNTTVRSSGLSAVPMTVSVEDLSGNKNGTTTFTRRYMPTQEYSVTAPASRVSGSTTYVFERWSYTVSPGGTVNQRPIGETTIEFASIGSLDDELTAAYKIRRTLAIRSVNPSSGVAISVSPDDINGNGNGSTSFTRYYRSGESVTLTAPASVGFNPFRHWTLNGRVQPGGRTLTFSITGTRTAEAVYYDNVAGSVSTVGVGCVGSSGRAPTHYATWPSGQQGPQQASPLYYRMRDGRPLAGGAINFGLSTRQWGAFRLPLDLGLIGVNGCSFYHDYVVSESVATDSRGNALFTVTWPVNTAAIGGSIYTSIMFIDPGAPRPMPLTLTNALRTVQGGNR